MINKSLIVLFFIPFCLQAQQSKTFKIDGHSDYYKNRKLMVFLGAGPLFNDCMIAPSESDTASNSNIVVQDGKFEVFGNVSYPHPLRVSYYDAENNQGYSSYFYFIEGGDMHINVDDLAKNKILGNDIESPSHREYQDLKKLYSGVVDTLTGRSNDMNAKQKLMHAYIAAHPNSYVALWDLLFDYAYAGDDSVNRDILENMQLFSPLLKKSKTYQALFKQLKKDIDMSLVVGVTFPDIDIKPSVSIKATAKENKFTLVDFWASWCEPCLQQFPDLKKVYKTYKENKFTIIGISVDKKEKEGDWKKVIQQFNLDWPQYLDVSGMEAEKLNVNSYPTNFLLDDKGIIIKKDISPEELKEFLEKNLN